jgi:hypothetical protein
MVTDRLSEWINWNNPDIPNVLNFQGEYGRYDIKIFSPNYFFSSKIYNNNP